MPIEIKRIEDLCKDNKEVYEAVNGPIKKIWTQGESPWSSDFYFEVLFQEIGKERVKVNVYGICKLMTSNVLNDDDGLFYTYQEEQTLCKELKKYIIENSPIYNNNFQNRQREWDLPRAN